MWKTILQLVSIAALSVDAWEIRGQRIRRETRNEEEDINALLNSMSDDPRLRSVQLLAKAVQDSRATVAKLQVRENALEEQHESLELSARDIAEKSHEVDKEVSGVEDGAHSKWVNDNPEMAEAGKSHLQTTFEAATEHLVSLALAGLTGVRASIPIFVMTVYSKFSEGSAIDLESGFEWLYSVPALICLGVFLALELICDCVPVVSEAMDAAMLIVKPAVAVVIALAPEYGNEGTNGTVISACGCCILALLVAVAKSAITRSADMQSTSGAAVPVRSFLEDLAVAALSLMSMGFSILAAVVVVALMFLLLSYGCFRGKKKQASQPVKAAPP